MDETSPHTRVVLGLFRNRVAGFMLAKLLSEPELNEDCLALLQGPSQEAELLEHAGSLMVAASKRSDFALMNPNDYELLSTDFGNIFWAELSDQLITNTSCEFNNFGTFYRTLGTRGLIISFAPSELLLTPENERLEGIELSGPAAERILADFCLEIVKRAAAQWMQAIDYRSIRREPKSRPQLADGLLGTALPSLVKSILTRFELGGSETKNQGNVFSFLTTGLAYCTYYLWILAFALELSAGGIFTVPSIGSFVWTKRAAGIVSQGLRELVVVFEIERDFLRLISVCIPPAPAIAA